MHKQYLKVLRQKTSSFNEAKLKKTIEKSSEKYAASTNAEFRELLKIMNIDCASEDNPFGALTSYFGFHVSKENVPNINDTQLSSVIMTLLYVKQQQGQLIIFSDTGWNTISDAELNRIIIAVSVVILNTDPPAGSKLKQVREYLEANAVSSDQYINRDYIQLINGCFHAATGEIKNHFPERIPMIRLNMNLADKSLQGNIAMPTRFHSFITEVTGHDSVYREYFLDAYASLLDLSAPTSMKGLILFGGTGRGKSILMDLLEKFFLPENVAVKSLDDIGKNFGLENFTRSMINISHELSSARPKAESVRQLKRLLDKNPGYTEVNAKFKRAQNWVIDLKMIFGSNSVIDFGKDQRGPLNRRITVLPFNTAPVKKDPELIDILAKEKEHILAYLLQRIHAIHRRGGFSPAPAVVIEVNNLWFSTEGYIANNPALADKVSKWLDAHIEKHEGERVDKAELNRKISNDIPDATSFVCNSIIQSELKYTEVKTNGSRFWKDMRWKSDNLADTKHREILIDVDYISDEYY